MADLTPEENESLTADAQRAMQEKLAEHTDYDAGALDGEMLFATAEVEEVLLDTEQRRRVEALLEARNILTSEVSAPASGGFLGAIGAGVSNERVDVPTKQYAGDLMMLADYILNPAPERLGPHEVYVGNGRTADVRVHGDVPGGVIVIPGEAIPQAKVESFAEAFTCGDPNCGCATGEMRLGGGVAIRIEGRPDSAEVGERIRRAFAEEFGADNVEPITIDREEG